MGGHLLKGSVLALAKAFGCYREGGSTSLTLQIEHLSYHLIKASAGFSRTVSLKKAGRLA